MSGGPDSTALLAMLVEARRKVVAATYDHALRPGSAGDVRAVRSLCDRLGVELVAERRTAEMPKGSIQAAARALRYEFLERIADERAADLIAVAHTEDDLLETVVMNVLRGCGVRGLRGMPARRGRIVRPLLNTTRAEIDGYLRASGLATATVTDPSNRDPRFLRARVRHHVLPALTAQQRQRLLSIARRAASVPTEPARGLGRIHRREIDRLLRTGRTGASLSLPGGVTFRVLPYGEPLFEHEPGGTATAPMLRERDCGGCDDADAVHVSHEAHLTAATRVPGLRMRPRGGSGTRKLQDLLVDAKVPRHLRDHLPLLFVDGRLAWVPGIAEDADLTLERGLPGRHVVLEGAWKADGIFGRQSPLEPQRGGA